MLHALLIFDDSEVMLGPGFPKDYEVPTPPN